MTSDNTNRCISTFHVNASMLNDIAMQQQMSCMPPETWNQILSFLNVIDIHKFMVTCKDHATAGRRYLLYRRLLLAKLFFENPQDFFDLLCLGQAIISGSKH
ncbi:hypothetical protein BKA82DRAFT_25992 [Pisolithus tinctorius]|uniref:F-box domain-containing protein n=1 Tax=Pisolithus tinctorius Marx 270 TaxID=870435 RepID=A0A0C3NVM5_PISTI|nr:hypothetical protein BKA82DRAFT_25992 [Pisolithus tinctorius]KIO04905.1 hypothetical protein M404DRAFT_25992 [Pisolithus tinctorius Marx 270]